MQHCSFASVGPLNPYKLHIIWLNIQTNFNQMIEVKGVNKLYQTNNRLREFEFDFR